MYFSPLIILKNMLITNTKTGNIIFDYVINFIILSLMTFSINNYRYLKNFFLEKIKKMFISKKYVELIIEAQNITYYDRAGLKSNKLFYSKTFQAITYFIKILQPTDVYSKREADKTEKDNNPIFDLFITDQNIYFMLNFEFKNVPLLEICD